MNTLLNSFYTQSVIDWLSSSGIRIALILIGAFVVRIILAFVIEKSIRRIVRADDASPVAETRRENTLISVFKSTTSVALFIVAFMMALSEAGLDIGPLIAAAGVIGLAVGFGGQYLIKDVLAGLFILLENQYRVGDIVELAGLSGTVERFNLRVTILRDINGDVHYVPNGQVSTSSNKTQGFSKINFNVGVGYSDDIDLVEKTINEVGIAMTKIEGLSGKIIEAPSFVRVDNFGDSSVDIRVSGKVFPGEQWVVAGEFRRRLKRAFDSHGIEIPYPQQVNHSAPLK